MASRAVPFLLLALLLLPAAGMAQAREPRYVGDYLFEGDPVAVAVSQGAGHIALATVQGVTLLDGERKPLWSKPLLSLVGVSITGPDIPRGPWVLAATREKIYLYDSAGELRLTSATTRPIRSVEITPDGSRMVIAQERYVEVRDKDGATVWNKDIGFQKTSAAIRDDGYAATLGPESATLWTPAGAESRTVSYGDLVTVAQKREQVSIAVSGDAVLIGLSDGTYIYDRPGGQQLRFRGSAASAPVLVRASPTIFAASTAADVVLRDIYGNLLKAPSLGGDASFIALTPDGRYLAAALKQRRLVVYDLGAVVPSFLNVTSTPDGTVSVDDRARGTTPLQIEIFPGPHRVVVNNSTLGEIPVTVVVPFGGQANLSVNLSRLAYPAALEVNSVPPGAEIFVDGGSLGTAPTTLSLSAGNHTLRVALSGFSAYTATLNLTADNLTRLNVTLAPEGQASSSTADRSTQEIPEKSVPQQAAGRETTWEVKLVSPPPTAAPTPTPEPPGFEAVFAAAALLLVGLAARRRRS
ncbi:MAG: PEGA domain-containing protein [Halobacteria archaeon]